MRNYIGIDPGKNGAIVSINEDGKVFKHVMPLISDELDIHGLLSLLLMYRPKQPIICIEQVHAIHGVSAAATFTFGGVYYAAQTAAAAMDIPYYLVQPKEWQKLAYLGVPDIRKPDILITKGKRAGQKTRGNRDTKAMSLIAAKRLFPTVDLRASDRCRGPHDGIVDALLIADYCRRSHK